MNKDIVRFNGKFTAFIGVVLGIALAAGLPTIILIFGHNLGVAIQTIIIILAILGGGTLAIVSAFFGIVIPSAVGDPSGLIPPGVIPKRVKVTEKNGQKTVEINGEEVKCGEED